MSEESSTVPDWNFSLAPQEFEFDAKDRDGNVTKMVLIESSGEDMDAYRTQMRKQTVRNTDGAAIEIDYQGLEEVLLVRALRRVHNDGTRTPFAPEEIASWPVRIRSWLTNKLDKMNEASKTDPQRMAEAKNG